MSRKFIFFSFALSLFLTVFSYVLIFCSLPVLADDNGCHTPTSNDQDQLQRIIDACNAQLKDLGEKRSTLKNEIAYMDTQITLTQSEINANEQKTLELTKEIANLGNRIGELETNLTKISKAANEKIVAIYKQQRIPTLSTFLAANNLPDFLRSIQYLKLSQEKDRQILIRTQDKKLNFKEQKTLREEKEEELTQLNIKLENYKISLANQQQVKESLLQTTQNDEQTYQNVLAQAKAEYAAIKGIISGAGNETKNRDVKKGEKIATIISGASCNSSGTHLHFMVKDNGNISNPFNYLKNIDNINDSGGDPFNPSGSWDWPINPTVRLNQGFGQTWAVLNTWVGRIYSFHDGIDIDSNSSNDVFAVADGELYNGGYAVGCTLPYVKLVHKDSNISTYYLHVYFN